MSAPEPPAAGARIGEWVVCMSRKAGGPYFFNPRTRASLWWSASLPHGWGKEVGEDRSEVFSSPSAGSVSEPLVQPAQATALPRLPSGWVQQGFPDERPGPAASAVARAVEQAESREKHGPLFSAVHALVLAQLLDAAAASAKRAESGRVTVLDLGAGLGRSTKFIVEHLRSRGLQPTVVAVDCWHAPFAGAMLSDHGHRGLAKATWSLCEPDAATAAAERPAAAAAAAGGAPSRGQRLRAGPTHMRAFLERLWDLREDVLPFRQILPTGLSKLRGDGIEPDVVFVDADLDRQRVRRLLRAVIECFPNAAICGGGWNLSLGVQQGVMDVVRGVATAAAAAKTAAAAASSAGGPGAAAAAAAAAAAPSASGADTAGSLSAAVAHPVPLMPVALHVEQGTAWTLTGHLIKQSRNKEEHTAVLASSRVAAEDVELAESDAAWVGNLVQLLERRDDGPRVFQLCRGRGRSVTAARAAVASTQGGVLPGEDPSRTWIDCSQLGSKRQLTALAVAAKNGRRDSVRALIASGARVNVQAAHSRGAYFPLQLAAFAGHEQVVRLLLRAGARCDLKTKWNKPAVAEAKKPAVIAMLRAVEALPPGAGPEDVRRAVGRDVMDDPEEARRDELALRGVYEPPARQAGPPRGE
ncbi:hypothetical protein FNF31_00330 [Cafeteria roenbergensis]|uniref:Uncharacterized protein n=1 Tax=Cafeteria roenbergensis TaxID=33653 RepID=A0A5A8DML7_CAFRO|nr:hypothetical protein FNF28_03109 [Cafeteria roenbergensis]KAA0168448.1 hypothetical protein FNF31_00330 [Cafeteria roenbergensis]